jgi:VanZ family protein
MIGFGTREGTATMSARRLFQIVGWLCIVAIVVFSLVSPALRPVTSLPHNLEHAAVFAVTGFAIALGYPRRIAHCIVMLITFAGVIELAQFFAPGRHPRVIDFVVDAAAACAGVLLAAIALRLISARRAQ